MASRYSGLSIARAPARAPVATAGSSRSICPVAAAQVARLRQRHGQGERRRDRGVDRIPAGAERIPADVRGMPLLCDHQVPGERLGIRASRQHRRLADRHDQQ
jgi:hypothetical protein